MDEPLMMDIAQQAGFRDGDEIILWVSFCLPECYGVSVDLRLWVSCGQVLGRFLRRFQVSWEGSAQILGKVLGQVLGRAGREMTFFAQKR